MSLQLGVRLTDLRKRNGLSQEALAEKMGVSRQAVSKWERGESTPDTDTLIELSRLYSVSLDSLVGNKEEATEQKEQQQPNKKTAKKEQKKATKKEPIEKGELLYPGAFEKMLMFPFPLFIITLYILLGFIFKLWHPMWLLFLLIPAYYHLAAGMKARTKRAFLLGIPVFEAALILFLILGLAFHLWSVAWVLFIGAVTYYWYAAFCVKK